MAWEKNFFENTYDKINDFVQPNKVDEKMSLKDSFNKALENWLITKEELNNLMSKFEDEKSNLWNETIKQLDDLKKEAISWMLQNWYDVRNSKDIDNLSKFISGTDLKFTDGLELKLSTIKAFYDKADKSMLENARDFIWYDNITLTVKDGKISEMGILDINNPLNDNEAKITWNYDLDSAISEDTKKAAEEAKRLADEAEKAKQVPEVVPAQNVEVVKAQEKPKLVDKIWDATWNWNKQDEKYTKSFLEKNFDKLNSLVLNNEWIRNSLISVLKDPSEANVQALQKTLGVKADWAFGQKTLDALSTKA